jgi:hypothetical protein
MHRTLFEVVVPICGLAIFGDFLAPGWVTVKGIGRFSIPDSDKN